MKTTSYKYHLEIGSAKHECPSCHHPKVFKRYVDNAGSIVDPTVGRCNREHNCGYHYTPSQFFRDNGRDGWKPATCVKPQPVEPPKPPMVTDVKWVNAWMGKDCNLYRWLTSMFPQTDVDKVWGKYFMGVHNGRVIYWLISAEGVIRTGKVIPYKDDGHRDHDGVYTWTHSILKRDGKMSSDMELTGHQCLFGEHLLPLRPDAVVGVVEAEKTALIASIVMPDYVWVATGSLGEFKPSKLAALKGRTCVAFPDEGAEAEWRRTAAMLRGIDIAVSTKHIEQYRNSFPAGFDFADILVSQYGKRTERISDSPAVKRLVRELSLQPVEAKRMTQDEWDAMHQECKRKNLQRATWCNGLNDEAESLDEAFWRMAGKGSDPFNLDPAIEAEYKFFHGIFRGRHGLWVYGFKVVSDIMRQTKTTCHDATDRLNKAVATGIVEADNDNNYCLVR